MTLVLEAFQRTIGTTRSANAGCARRRALAILTAVFCATASGCAWDAPLKPPGRVVRLGHATDYRTVPDATRPLVGTTRPTIELSATEKTVLSIPAVPASVLHLVAALRPVAESPSTCRVRVIPVSGEPKGIEITPPIAHNWAGWTLELPALDNGATLEVDCDSPSEIVLAQPYLTPKAGESGPPLVVVLSLDTLRADYVEGFGGQAGSTPSLARIGAEGLRMKNAASEFTWTLPSHFALFHSRFFGFPSSVTPLDGFVQEMADAGFATAAFTGGGFVSVNLRMHYGFDVFREYDATKMMRAEIDLLPGVLKEARTWVEKKAGAPAFVFVHTYAVHQPPPAEVARNPKLLFDPSLPNPEQIGEARDFYAGLVRKTDAVLDPFFAWLRDQSRVRPTLLVVMSDHGEAFGEHENFRHGSNGAIITLHDEVVHVPMLFWAPGLVPPARTSDIPIGLLDIAPTVLGAVGLAPAAGMMGRDLWPEIADRWDQQLPGRDALRNRPALSFKARGPNAPAQWSLRDQSTKLIVNADAKPLAARSELYALQLDPSESSNRATSAPEAFSTSLERLWNTHREVDVPVGPKGQKLAECLICATGCQIWADIDVFLDSIDPLVSCSEKERTSTRGMDAATKARLRGLGYVE